MLIRDSLSTQRGGHWFGKDTPAQPIRFQQHYEEMGWSALTVDTKTEEKIIYLTFDCGYENGQTARILDVLKEKNVSAAFFVTLDYLKEAPEQMCIRDRLPDIRMRGGLRNRRPELSFHRRRCEKRNNRAGCNRYHQIKQIIGKRFGLADFVVNIIRPVLLRLPQEVLTERNKRFKSFHISSGGQQRRDAFLHIIKTRCV